nr:phage holin family protein [Demequina litorisediminis]
MVEVLRLLTVAYDVLGHESLPVSAWLAPLAGSAGVLVLAWVAPTRRWFETEADRRLARAMASSPRSPWRRGGELLAQAVVLALTVWWTPGVGADAWFAVPLAAVAVALVSWALQPLLTGIAARFGWLGALATALLGYFAILGAALWVAPGIVVASPGWAFVASWIFAALMAAVTWAFSLGTDEYLLTHVARQALSDAPAAPSDGARGVIMVQARRRACAAPAGGTAGGKSAHLVALDQGRHPHVDRVDGARAIDYAGQPGGHPARLQRGHPCLPLVGQGPGPHAGRQQACRCRCHRVAHLRRQGPPCRRRGVDLQSLYGRCRDRAPDDVCGGGWGIGPGFLAAVRGLLLPPGGVCAGARDDGGRDAEGGGAGAVAGAPRHRTAGGAPWVVHRPAGRHQCDAAGPQHGAGGRIDGARREGGLRRLRGLRRDRAPCRRDAAGVVGVAVRARPGARHARARRRLGHRGAGVRHRGRVRPRSKPGCHVRATRGALPGGVHRGAHRGQGGADRA